MASGTLLHQILWVPGWALKQGTLQLLCCGYDVNLHPDIQGGPPTFGRLMAELALQPLGRTSHCSTPIKPVWYWGCTAALGFSSLRWFHVVDVAECTHVLLTPLTYCYVFFKWFLYLFTFVYQRCYLTSARLDGGKCITYKTASLLIEFFAEDRKVNSPNNLHQAFAHFDKVYTLPPVVNIAKCNYSRFHSAY